MKRHTDKGKGFLKDKLGAYQADPPPEVWDAISSQLGGRSRRRMTIILLSAAASLALAVTLGITYFGRDIPHDIELAEDPEGSLQNESGLSSSSSQRASLEKRVVQAVAEVGAVPAISEVLKSGQLPESSDESSDKTISDTGVIRDANLATDTMLVKDTMLATDANLVKDTMLATDANLATDTMLATDAHIATDTMLVKDTMLASDERDEMPEEILLNAGEVGDVEMLPDLGEVQDQDPRWVLGAMLSPLYSFRDAEPEALDGTSGQESGMVSYATGVQVGYRATRRLAFESGIIYNKMGLSIGAPGIQVFANNQDYEWAAPDIGSSPLMAITNSVGNIVSYSGDIYVNNYKLNASADQNRIDNVLGEVAYADQGIQQHLDYLEVPFNLRYTLLDRSFKIQVVGGVSTNLLVNNYVTMETDAGTTKIGYLTNLRNVNYSGNAGVGFVYHFLEQLSLNVEPRFRYYLNSVNDATLPSTRPFTFGIYTGLNYFF